MAAAVYNITIEPYAEFTLNFTYKANGAAVNLTGYKAGFQVSDSYGGTVDSNLTCTTENGGITLGGSAGTVAVWIPASKTALTQLQAGVYDLRLIPPAGEDYAVRLLQGKVKINPAVDTVD